MTDLDRYRRTEALIAGTSRARFGNGAPEHVIADAERHLGVSFPPTYRWWLRRYGGGYLGGCALQGLFPVPIEARDPDYPPVGDVVETARLNSESGELPEHLLEILSYDGDEVYYLDTSRSGADGEYPIICRYAGDPEPQDVAPDFLTFLERELGAEAAEVHP